MGIDQPRHDQFAFTVDHPIWNKVQWSFTDSNNGFSRNGKIGMFQNLVLIVDGDDRGIFDQQFHRLQAFQPARYCRWSSVRMSKEIPEDSSLICATL